MLETMPEAYKLQFRLKQNRQITHFDWSSDGKRLAYAQSVVFKDVVVIGNFN